jgi:hypothetical protein
MTELQRFDPSALMDGVRQRIKATFVSLIPDEHWEQLCQKEVDSFFREKDRYDHNDRTYHSEFQGVCKEVLTEICKEKIKLFLTEYDATVWTNDGMQASEKLKEMIIKMAPEIFAATFANMFQNAVSQMKRY